MANNFNKEERVAFDQVFEKFEDGLVVSNLFAKYTLDDVTAERSGNTIWRPQPYIAQVFSGLDQSANFNRNYTQLSVPATLGYQLSVPLTLSATELRDQLQEKRLGEAAMQGLSSQINVAASNLAALTGTVFVKRTSAAAGFDDVAAIDNAFNRVGVPMNNRKALYASSDYNNMASALQASTRSFGNSVSENALRRAMVGTISNFDTYKLDYAYRLTVAAGSGTTLNAANQYYTPKATSTSATGEVSNVDNRYQTITVNSTTNVKAGDAFTIAGVNEAHHITKADTGSLKTFRVISVPSSTTLVISPPIISAGGASDPEKQYQNVVGTPASTAAITWLNTASGFANPFWQDDAFEIVPGNYRPAEDAALAVLRATTSNGVTVTMTRQGNIGDLSCRYRWDTFFGLVNKQPEMSGVEMFSQP
jgi:P22 coat protein - gene protein 5